MKKQLKRILCIFLIMVMLLSTGVNAFADNIDKKELNNDINFFELVIQFVNANYQYDINQTEVIAALYKGLSELMRSKTAYKNQIDPEKLSSDIKLLAAVVNSIADNKSYNVTREEIMNVLYDSFFNVLDTYSVYFTPEELKQFTAQIAGEFGGIGIQITEENGKVFIAAPIPDTPAQRAGLKANDVFYSVDGQKVEGYPLQKVSELIKGEIGTKVNIGILRNNTILYFTLTRELITISSVESKELEHNIGYIKITEFNDNTPTMVKEALVKFSRDEITKLIIDVRDNPGGSLDSVVSILNYFVEKGPLVYVNYKSSGEYCIESEAEKLKQKYDLCVLVNENSASASEIFAGAIQDRKAGKIIGTTTYGKGVVQTIYPLKNNSGVKFTTAEYFTPNKHKVQGKGITPDIVIENARGKAKVDLATIPELKKERKATLNTVGIDVLGAEMILQYLGYKVTKPDGILDNITLEQIKLFQTKNNLYCSGVLDYSTQDALTTAIKLYAEPDEKDTQLEKAIEILKK